MTHERERGRPGQGAPADQLAAQLTDTVTVPPAPRRWCDVDVDLTADDAALPAYAWPSVPDGDWLVEWREHPGYQHACRFDSWADAARFVATALLCNMPAIHVDGGVYRLEVSCRLERVCSCGCGRERWATVTAAKAWLT